jgi:hypothetical protein
VALQGTLEDFGIADIFQLIGQQQKTGILVLNQKGNVVHINFRDGFIVSAEVQNRDQSERLGQMMVHAGLINVQQLDSALDIQRKTLQKLGAILTERQFIKKSELDEFIYLQTKETIFKLFRWRAGTYQFHQQEVRSTSEFFQPISAEHILMDGFRIIDEWPSIRKKIGSFANVFEIIPGTYTPFESLARPDLDQDLDVAFSSFEEGQAPAGLPERLPPNGERVFELIDGKRDVKTIIAYSRLGEFDSCQALALLIDRGIIRLGSANIQKAQESNEKLNIELYQDYEGTRKNILSLFPNAVYYGTFLFVLFVFISYLGLGPLKFLFDPGRKKIERHIFHSVVSDYQEDRLRMAIEIFYLKKQQYPHTLQNLLHEGLIRGRDLSHPWKNPYDYQTDGAQFTLNKPFN